MTKYPVLFKDETGSSIIEVMIATVVFIIIMVGGLNYYVQPQIIEPARQKIKRLAISSAQSRMEILRALDFTASTKVSAYGNEYCNANVTFAIPAQTIKRQSPFECRVFRCINDFAAKINRQKIVDVSSLST